MFLRSNIERNNLFGRINCTLLISFAAVLLRWKWNTCTVMWQNYFTFTTSFMPSYAVEVCWCLTSYNLIVNKIIPTKHSVLVAWLLALIACLCRLGRDRYKFVMYTLEMDYLLVTSKLGQPWNKWCVVPVVVIF